MHMQKKLSNTKKNLENISENLSISYLNLVALSDNYPEMGSLITSKISDNNCVILNSKIINLGQNVAVNMLISGKWNEIAKLEKAINQLTRKNNFIIYLKRNNLLCDSANTEETYIDYIVQATIINKAKFLQELVDFFHREKIQVNFVNFNSNNIDHRLANLEIQVKIPTNLNILNLRENFISLCDYLNLDVSLEPYYR